MNRWTYRWSFVIESWLFLFITMGVVLVLSVCFNVFDFSCLKALWYAFLYASVGSSIGYIGGVLAYPFVKDL